MSAIHNDDWFLMFLGKVSVFFVFATCILVFYYMVGNFQGFIDSTQRMLLTLLELASLIGFIIEVYKLILFFIRAVREKKMQIGRFIRGLVFLLYFLGIYLLLKFLATWL
jgi:hypothetical protein